MVADNKISTISGKELKLKGTRCLPHIPHDTPVKNIGPFLLLLSVISLALQICKRISFLRLYIFKDFHLSLTERRFEFYLALHYLPSKRHSLYIILPRLMKMNKSFFLISAAMIILVTANSQLTETFAQQDLDVTFGQHETNMTGIESKLKSVTTRRGFDELAALVILFMCWYVNQTLGNVVEDCQIFQGSPIQ